MFEISGGVIVDSVPSDIGDSRRLDYEQNVQDAIAILPQLQTGIDVNVRFTGVSFTCFALFSYFFKVVQYYF